MFTVWLVGIVIFAAITARFIYAQKYKYRNYDKEITVYSLFLTSLKVIAWPLMVVYSIYILTALWYKDVILQKGEGHDY